MSPVQSWAGEAGAVGACATCAQALGVSPLWAPVASAVAVFLARVALHVAERWWAQRAAERA